MTIYFPDLSHWDGAQIEPGTVAVIAKATQATSIADPTYPTHKAQAANTGAIFAAYHWLNATSLDAQARWCHQNVGDVPLMIDAEDVPGNTGYTRTLAVLDIVTFAQAFRALGGTCNLVYLPHWYWERMGSPDLSPLAAAGLSLVSSNYTTYSDDGPGWAPYGGLTPVIWQYTNALPYGGSHADFNAFKGTVGDLWALMSGQPMGADMTTIDDVRKALAEVIVYGGDSMGPGVPDPLPESVKGNSVADLLQHLVKAVDAPKTGGVDVAALAEALKPELQRLVGDAVEARLQGARISGTVSGTVSGSVTGTIQLPQAL